MIPLQQSMTIGEKYFPVGKFARSHSDRRKGLSGMSIDQCPDELIFEKCRSIHTFGMQFDLEILFLDKDSRVLKSRIVKKRRIVFGPKGTHTIIERPFR